MLTDLVRKNKKYLEFYLRLNINNVILLPIIYKHN